MPNKIIYTPALQEVSYTEQYPDMMEFTNPWENCEQVGQGGAKVSLEGKPLQSDGFGRCFGLILRNQSNLESALFHVDDTDLTHEQTPAVDKLMRSYVSSLEFDGSEKEVLLAVITDITKYEYPTAMKREQFQSRMEELNAGGIIQARFVIGDASRDVRGRIVGSLLGYLGVKVVDNLRVNTGEYHWGMVYKPKEAVVLVNARKQKKVLSYTF